MVRENGMIMMPEDEYNNILNERDSKIKELHTSNKMLRKYVMDIVKRFPKNKEDVEISRKLFCELYDGAVEDMFNSDSILTDLKNEIYDYPVMIHWHGFYCNCGDGSEIANYIIPAIREVEEEIGE